jgi:uncharacterized Zn-finger protein
VAWTRLAFWNCENLQYNAPIFFEEGSIMSATIPAQQNKVCKISQKDLPLSCPPKDTLIWNQHPRVFLPIEEQGEVVCPYCSAKYVLTR